MKKIAWAGIFLSVLWACEHPTSENQGTEALAGQVAPNLVYEVPLKELSDADYPDNPDISIRSSLDGTYSHSQARFVPLDNGHFDVVFPPANSESDTLTLLDLDLVEWMPAVPDYIREDSFLVYVGILNQEFNRQQVKLGPDHFTLSGKADEQNKIQRVDLARNCLNAGLWEVIAYSEEQEQQKPAYHAWFDFPDSLYKDLFQRRNGDLNFDHYFPLVKNWTDPPQEKIRLELLREVKNELELEFTSRNDEYYPLVGERKKKHPNIVYPKPDQIERISDFLNDSTKFSTFSPPGFYDTNAPKSTELSRFHRLERIIFREIHSKSSAAGSGFELDLEFSRAQTGEKMHFLVGGLQRDQIPSHPVAQMHKGFQMPMGIANHSFYEKYEVALKNSPHQNPYYGLLTDAEGRFLDSHTIGIDGPLLHFDPEDPNRLHFWILSFERHAFVGHFEIQFPPAIEI